MRAKLVTLGITAVATLTLVVQASSQAVAQGNTSKAAAAKKKAPPPPPPKPVQAKPAQQPADAGQTMMAAKPKPKPKKKASAMAGVPRGVPACIKRLTQLAAKDPLIDYDGRPSEIINGGLLWADPKSRCSVTDDEGKKKKVLDLAGAWRRKDASQVRSLLQELAQ
jgi:hypothetical protein